MLIELGARQALNRMPSLTPAPDDFNVSLASRLGRVPVRLSLRPVAVATRGTCYLSSGRDAPAAAASSVGQLPRPRPERSRGAPMVGLRVPR